MAWSRGMKKEWSSTPQAFEKAVSNSPHSRISRSLSPGGNDTLTGSVWHQPVLNTAANNPQAGTQTTQQVVLDLLLLYSSLMVWRARPPRRDRPRTWGLRLQAQSKQIDPQTQDCGMKAKPHLRPEVKQALSFENCPGGCGKRVPVSTKDF